MLYEFHRKQNAKRPGAVHATYLIAGTKKAEGPSYTNGARSQDDDDDTVMQSSPPLPSSSAPMPDETMDEPPPMRSIMLVKEEDLEQARATFATISSIHIYSLESKGVSDVQALTDCNRQILVTYASDDPLEAWKQYGTIHNPRIKKRIKRTAAPPSAAAVGPKANDPKPKPAASTTSTKVNETKPKPEAASASNKPAPDPAERSKPASKPPLNKRSSSDIFKSFAKTAPKAKKQDSQDSAVTSPAPQAADETSRAAFSEDDDDDDDEEMEDAPAAAAAAAVDPRPPTGKSAQERKADLQAMMDREDSASDEKDSKSAAPISPTPEETSTTKTRKEEEEEADEEAAPKDPPPPPTTTSITNGRKRGHRRVLKKKTVKDEEGYLGEWRLVFYILSHLSHFLATFLSPHRTQNPTPRV